MRASSAARRRWGCAPAGEEGGGGFVGRGLGDEAASKGFFQERLPQGLAPPQRGVEFPRAPLGGKSCSAHG